MRCLHLNIRQATFIILCIITNNITIIHMTDHNKVATELPHEKPVQQDTILPCKPNTKCSDLHPLCIDCNLKNISCIYGETMSVNCKPTKMNLKCEGQQSFERSMICRYCYQTEVWEHQCEQKASCNSIASPTSYYVANCTVNDDILCLGNRVFNKNVRCNWTGGYRWSTALILSVTLGGFGADRFYLGHWQEGIGKLFSFGGLGVWTIIDVILISLHYLGPADGSLYI